MANPALGGQGTVRGTCENGMMIVKCGAGAIARVYAVPRDFVDLAPHENRRRVDIPINRKLKVKPVQTEFVFTSSIQFNSIRVRQIRMFG